MDTDIVVIGGGVGGCALTARRGRMTALLRTRPELAAVLAAVHAGPWSPPAEAFSPDILTTVALA